MKKLITISTFLALVLTSSPTPAEPAPSALLADQSYVNWAAERTDQWEVELDRLESVTPFEYLSTYKIANLELKRIKQDLRKKRSFGLSSALEQSLVGRVYRLERKIETLSSAATNTEQVLTQNEGDSI